ncbi:sodium/glucose cotransporter 1-like [Platysternon megacephalum]|uniref:Sodium/glucose cotransporter 1-like n=1 Tax=Platysternon megacephalum TaxID=55544 RepID=A0A4D9E1J5_9SAUR|nr:sodium/glucose cotransporter 1-like [Platysternon megacephalum]
MSGSGRKDFDMKHILRLRWKLFSHPSAPAGPVGGGCLQPDGSFEHWGPSQSRLLKNQERGSSAFWKKSSSSSPLNGTLLPATRHGLGQRPSPRTVFYVETLEEEEVRGGMELTREQEKSLVLQEMKEEPADCSDCSSQATGEGCGHRSLLYKQNMEDSHFPKENNQ